MPRMVSSFVIKEGYNNARYVISQLVGSRRCECGVAIGAIAGSIIYYFEV